LRVAFLDVGQADATVLILPDGRALLVDAALGPLGPLAADPGRDGGFDAGQQVVAPALRALGVRRLEALVITHGDPDHVGGAGTVAVRFRPRVIWEGVPVPPHAGLRLLAELASALGASWRTVQAGDVERFGPVTIRVLHPPRPEWERQRVRNEDSVVLEITLGCVAIVLPGDIGAEGEAASVALLPARPRLVVLKAPHHGSASSSTPAFLSALQPDVVVFSAGRPSRYGHPASAVVARYRARGTAIFSTPEDGAVVLDTDGEGVELKTATGRLLRWRMEPTAPPSHRHRLGSASGAPPARTGSTVTVAWTQGHAPDRAEPDNRQDAHEHTRREIYPQGHGVDGAVAQDIGRRDDPERQHDVHRRRADVSLVQHRGPER
jgi:competence protein ComEC